MYFASVDADTADDLDKAANVFAMRGLYEEALRYQERALMLRAEAFGPKSLEAATSLFAMGRLLHLQGRDSEARRIWSGC